MILRAVLFFWLVTFIFFRREIRAIQERDPSARSALEIVVLYPGLHALVFHRLAHSLWRMKVPFFPRALAQFSKMLTGIEIHPGAVIGQGLLIDHGAGVVIGETAVIGENVTLYQGVTLGGTGKECGKRHPTLGNNIVVGAGAKILGNIEVGDNSYVGANAVVLHAVPANATVVGVPGYVTRQDGEKIDRRLDHAKILDPVREELNILQARLAHVEGRTRKEQG